MGLPGGNGARKPCTARFPNPPHMSPDSDCIWRALALQTSRKGFLTVWAFLRVERFRLRRPFSKFSAFPSRLFGPLGRDSVRKPCTARPESAAHVAGFAFSLEAFPLPTTQKRHGAALLLLDMRSPVSLPRHSAQGPLRRALFLLACILQASTTNAQLSTPMGTPNPSKITISSALMAALLSLAGTPHRRAASPLRGRQVARDAAHIHLPSLARALNPPVFQHRKTVARVTPRICAATVLSTASP